jgi:hypothetical protein
VVGALVLGDEEVVTSPVVAVVLLESEREVEVEATTSSSPRASTRGTITAAAITTTAATAMPIHSLRLLLTSMLLSFNGL